MADPIYLYRTAISETEYTMKYIKDNIAAYKLNEITNGRCPDAPGIHEAYPLTLEYGASLDSDGDNYTTLLPAIGVELIPDNEGTPQTLGRKQSVFEINQAFIDELTAIPIRDRILTGNPVADSTLQEIQDALDAAIAADDKLYANKTVDLHNQSLTVSIWTDDITVKNLLYKTVRAILKRMRFVVSALGVKNMAVNGTDGFYNFDFDKTLYGAEFNVTWIQNVTNITIDPNVKTLKDLELFQKGLPINVDTSGIIPVAIGEGTNE